MAEMSIFKRIASATATVGGNWIKDGSYILAVKEVKYEMKFKGLTWVTELLVVTADAMPGVLEVGGEACAAGTLGAIPVVPSAVGTKVSFVAPIGDANIPNAAGNVKAFMLALCNTRESDFDAAEAAAEQKRMLEEAQVAQFMATKNLVAAQELMEKLTPSPFEESCKLITGPTQMMRGALIRCTTTRKVNQGRNNPSNKGKILVMPTWAHIPHDPTAIKARRALIDQGLSIPWSPAAQAA